MSHDDHPGPARIRTCPSAPLYRHASVLGLVQQDGTIAFLGAPIPVDAEFIATASRGRSAGSRFRFSGKCMESGCARWDGGKSRCEVATSVLHQIRRKPPAAALPDCGIRATCRWYAQEGAPACAVCSDVIYDGDVQEP